MKCTRLALGCTVAALALGAAGGAQAQDTPTASTSEDIVVTAQRRNESVIDVPISITVHSAESLEEAGLTRLEDLGQVTPGLVMQNTGTNFQPAIRGISSALAGGGLENNVTVYVDGIYHAQPTGLNFEFANLQRIQVLKGPQGTLFGRNSTGGAILIDTLDPDMDELQLGFGGGVYSFNDHRAHAYLSVPLGDYMAWNIAGHYRESDGYIRNRASAGAAANFDTAPIDNFEVLSKLQIEPTDALTIQLRYEAVKISDARTLAATSEGANSTAAANPTAYEERQDYWTSVNYAPESWTKLRTYSASANYDFGPFMLNALASRQDSTDFNNFDRDYTTRRANEGSAATDAITNTIDVNLTSSAPGPFQYVVGMFYYDQERNTVAYAVTPGSPTIFPHPSDVNVNRQFQTATTESLAAYADLTWEVLPHLFLTGGVRYNDETVTMRVFRGDVAISGCQTPAPTSFGQICFNGEQSFEDTTPRVVLRYELDESSSIYASVTQGSRSGFIANGTPFNTIQPEEVTAYEIGYKTQQDRFRFETAAYFYDYSNMQIALSREINGQTVPVTANADSAEIYGVEAQFDVELLENFNASLGATYNHAEYTSFPNATVLGIAGINATGTAGLNTSNCTVPVAGPCTQSFTGFPLNRSPEYTANVGLDYTLASPVGTFVFSGNGYYTDDFVPTRGDRFPTGHPQAGQFRFGQEAYTLYNARIAWSPPNADNITVALVGQNLTDERYYIYRSGSTFSNFAVLGTPQTFGITFDYDF